MKNIIKIFGFIGIIIVVYGLFSARDFTRHYEDAQNSHYTKIKNYSEFRSIDTNSTMAKIAMKDQKNYYLIEGDYPPSKGLLNLPSGPPVYVFNEDGVIVDYSPDVGDDLDFRDNRWKYYDIKETIRITELDTKWIKHEAD